MPRAQWRRTSGSFIVTRDPPRKTRCYTSIKTACVSAAGIINGGQLEPFLRWAGSKRQLLPELKAYWPAKPATYVEPFAGSAALFFSLGPRNAILGDLNEDLINALRAVQAFPVRVIEALRRIPIGEEAYYRVRRTRPAELSNIERAAHFIYLNHYCFNGLYRTNLRGDFNVPFGRHKGEHLLDFDLIWKTATLLRGVMLVAGDFERTLSFVNKADFVYLDPPYALHEYRAGFAEYHPKSFSVNDLQRLEAALERLDSIRAHFVLSYANSAEARRIGRRWNMRKVWVRRNIAGFASNRRGVAELLISNREPKGAVNDH